MTRTYTTQQARVALGLTSASSILRIIKRLGIVPTKIPCEFNAAGFVYQFSQEQIDVMKARRKYTTQPTEITERRN